MGPYQIPNLKDFHSGAEFFAQFQKINADVFNHRSFADALHWPSSLLADLVTRRKRLSLARAVEFARHFNFNSKDTEYLIMLSLKDTENPAVVAYADEYLSTEGAAFDISAGFEFEGQLPHPISSQLYCDLSTMILLPVMALTKGKVSLCEISQMLPTFPEFADENILRQKLENLKREGVIRGEAPDFEVLHDSLQCLEPQSHLRFLSRSQNHARLVNKSGHKKIWQSASLMFPRAKYPELFERIKGLLSWTFRTTMMAKKTSTDYQRDFTVLQLDILCSEHLKPNLDASPPKGALDCSL